MLDRIYLKCQQCARKMVAKMYKEKYKVYEGEKPRCTLCGVYLSEDDEFLIENRKE